MQTVTLWVGDKKVVAVPWVTAWDVVWKCLPVWYRLSVSVLEVGQIIEDAIQS